uniref:Uncharacterized protein n=1 Tax=Mus musculus TaxID=10090 RepID=Q8BWR0_MOUSE|nr:unnamed protein product [Mus musculus]
MSTGADLKAREGDIPSDNMTQEQSFKKGFCSLRHGLAFILHLCNFSIYTQQMNLSFAITAMVNTTVASSQLNASTERPPTNSQDVWNETLQESKAPVYDWTPEIQGHPPQLPHPMDSFIRSNSPLAMWLEYLEPSTWLVWAC